jgi:hypothetical protein
LASEAVPLLALLMLRPVAALWTRPGGRRLVIAIGVLALFLHVPALYRHAELWNARLTTDGGDPAGLWDWADAPFLYPYLHGAR